MKREEVDKSKLSPMMKQYLDIKEQYLEELLFFRLGDFYELFFEDGITASRELELTLTGKNAGLSERVPMCGVPFHSVKPYIDKLIKKGYKVAICEQLEDPKNTKGMVKRGVVNVISKGTVVDLESLDSKDFNYIGALIDIKSMYVLTYCDVSTGSIYTKSVGHQLNKIVNEIVNLGIKELIVQENHDLELINNLKINYGVSITVENNFLSDYKELYSKIEDEHVINSIQLLLYYLVVRELKDISHFNEVIMVDNNDYLEMDIHTVKNLELIETIRLKERTHSLLWLLDETKTAMGSRTLKSWLLNPLKDIKKINERYDMISTLNNEFMLREELIHLLDEVYDIERLCGKISCGSLNARDLLQLKKSLYNLPRIKKIISLLKFKNKINSFPQLFTLLEKAIYEEPPVTIKEGYLIKDGYNSELDELKNIRSGGKEFIATLEADIRTKTNIKTLKVGFNKIFGYYIEVSKLQSNLIEEEWGWERKQTLTDKERYISPLLKEKEELILNAEEKIIELEYHLFMEIKEIIKTQIKELKNTSMELGIIDAICSLAIVGEENSFVRPIFNQDNDLNIIEGRHPVVEKVNKIDYVANDCNISGDTRTLLITGPNMSGKSTYMRQVAIIVIMAQMGSFVPAKECYMPIFDKIFTRIGASDDLVSGESTFMVEMLEARNAIVNATPNSLILFDELGRGTATYDGMSIAQAILEYVNINIKCITLFSTHYHELTSLEKTIKSIKNIHVEAHEEDGEITFLHKVNDGPVDKSYGIHVAKLSTMPNSLIKRAEEILKVYEANSRDTKVEQISFNLETKKSIVEDILNDLDLNNITPLEAINILNDLKEKNKE